MKTLFKLLPALLMLTIASCEKYPARLYRSEVFGSGNGRGTPRDSLPGKEPQPAPDTTVYIVAVQVPESYDWRRDTSYGAVPYDIVLYEDDAPLLSFKTGISQKVDNAPDTYHLMGGNIYTEYSSSGETVITRNGTRLFSYKGSEVLVGMLVKGNDVYTLGRDKSGYAFSFRLNGEVLLSGEGAVYGNFGLSSTGALYETDGRPCFCFRNNASCYAVRGGIEEAVRTNASPGRIKFMRVFPDGVWYATDYGTMVVVSSPFRSYTMPVQYTWSSCSLAEYEGRAWFVGTGLKAGKSCTVVCPVEDAASSQSRIYSGDEGYLYFGDGAVFSVGNPGGTLMVQGNGAEYIYGRDSSFFFGRSCAAAAGESLYMVVTPKEKDMVPFLWKNGLRKEFGINGYLAGVEVRVSPAN